MKELKKLHLKAASLCNDYTRSLEYEKCTHHLTAVKDSGGYGYGENRILMLVHIPTKEVVTSGGLRRIKSYMNLRNIKSKDIFEWDKLTNQNKDKKQ